jgi:hypothetical protein
MAPSRLTLGQEHFMDGTRHITHALFRARSARLAIAAVAALAFAAPAQAAVGGFSASDGSELATGTDCITQLDWQCLTASQLVTSLDGSDNIAFSSGKEDQPDGWNLSGGSVGASKAAFDANWSYSYTDPAFTTNYMAVAFHRLSGSGSSFLGFELNQSNATYVNSVGSTVTCRTNGDVLISFELGTVGTPKISMYKWTWNPGQTPCTPGAAGSFSTPVTLGSADAEAAVNSGSIVNYLSTSALGASFDAGTFGEAAVNLTALANAIQPTATCEYFNHLQLTSRSSQSVSSSMQDFVDGGAISARACESPGGGSGGGSGGGTCTTAPQVAIVSPADGSTLSSNTVTVNGTSDQANVELVDGTTVVGTPAVTGGIWQVALTNVASGQHTYSAVATDGNGCTSTAHVTVTVPASSGNGGSGGNGSGTGSGSGGNGSGTGSGSGGNGSGTGSGSGGNGSGTGSGSGTGTGGNGSGTGSGSGTGTGALRGVTATPTSCTALRFAITDIYPRGNRVHILGTAPAGTAGKTVTIVALWGRHKVVGHAKVTRGLTFSVTGKLPPMALRTSRRARYAAKLGRASTAPVAYARRLYNTGVSAKGRRITFSGVIVAPLGRPIGVVTIRAVAGCGTLSKALVLARAKPHRNGRYTVRFTVPLSVAPTGGLISLQAQTIVRRNTASRRGMSVTGLTRSLLISA